jgi:hypothetical protein
MLDRIQPSVRDRTQSLRSEFSAAQPFRHVVIDDFLDPDLCARLIQKFPAFDARNAVNEHGEVGRKAVFTDVARIGKSYAEFDGLMRSRAFLDWLGTLVEVSGAARTKTWTARSLIRTLISISTPCGPSIAA